MIINRKSILFLVAITIATNAAPIDNGHFYKAAQLHRSSTTSWFDESKKYENYDWFTKIDASYAYGETKSCWDKNDHSAPLLNSTGSYNMLYIFENVVKTPSVQDYATFFGEVTNHAETNGTFGLLDFNGKFKINDFNINIRQNLVSNFFLELLTPIRNVSISNISYNDRSPATGFYSKNTPNWINFLNNFDTVLSNYGLNTYNKKFNKTAFGDITLLGGWQGDFKTEGEDPMRFALTTKLGILFPSGAKENTNYLFSVPTGYNGHWGIPIFGQFDIMPKKWFTFTAHGSAAFFFDKTMNKRMKTFSKQEGYLRLAQGNAKEEKGTLWHIGLDAKIDHFLKGLSFLFGYSYNKQEKDTLNPSDTTLFDSTTVNGDSLLKGWTMQVLHFMFDYDFSVHMKDSKWAPRLNVFYNYPFDGKNAFKTDMIGGGLGLDIRWKI